MPVVESNREPKRASRAAAGGRGDPITATVRIGAPASHVCVNLASTDPRIRHYKVVARIIGDKVVGTQGTPVEVLGRLIHKSFYPELWEVRNELTALAQESD